MSKTTLVVDGSNIATEGRSKPSLQQLDEAVTDFLTDHTYDHVIVIVDATFGHRIDPSESAQFEEAILAGEVTTPPAGAIGRGDAFILQIADKADADVLSNDSFQEFHGSFDWLFDEGRLIGGKPVQPLGWVFVHRSPVRGPASRKAVRDARDNKGAKGEARPGPKKRARQPSKATAPAKKRSSETPNRAGRRPKVGDSLPDPGHAPEKTRAPSPEQSQKGKRGRGSTKSVEPINKPAPFLEFVSSFEIGSIVPGEVIEFSSHGAYVMAHGARCYVPLKAMGDPAPKSAREVLRLGDVLEFDVVAFDTPRRGIDLGFGADVADRLSKVEGNPRRGDDELIENRARSNPAEEAMLAPAKKATSKKSAAKKAPAKKAPAKKAAAKKAPAKRPAKKAPAKKAPAKRPAKKAPAKKAPAKKATAGSRLKSEGRKLKREASSMVSKVEKKASRKSPAKKAPAKKAPAKKAPAKKAPAKKR